MIQSITFQSPFTLSIDVGGTGIKMMVLDAEGQAMTEYLKQPTPQPATVEAVCEVFRLMMQSISVPFDRISAGIPGVISKGIIKTAPHLDTSWLGVNVQKKLESISGKPTRVANDAGVQGLGDICGQGVELVITLGTGVGSALYHDGKLIPNLELGHHPFLDNFAYEELLAKAYLEINGHEKWRLNLKRAIQMWAMVFNYDWLYIGGGFSHLIDFKLPANVKISDNIAGVLGGVKLWEN